MRSPAERSERGRSPASRRTTEPSRPPPPRPRPRAARFRMAVATLMGGRRVHVHTASPSPRYRGRPASDDRSAAEGDLEMRRGRPRGHRDVVAVRAARGRGHCRDRNRTRVLAVQGTVGSRKKSMRGAAHGVSTSISSTPWPARPEAVAPGAAANGQAGGAAGKGSRASVPARSGREARLRPREEQDAEHADDDPKPARR